MEIIRNLLGNINYVDDVAFIWLNAQYLIG